MGSFCGQILPICRRLYFMVLPALSYCRPRGSIQIWAFKLEPRISRILFLTSQENRFLKCSRDGKCWGNRGKRWHPKEKLMSLSASYDEESKSNTFPPIGRLRRERCVDGSVPQPLWSLGYFKNWHFSIHLHFGNHSHLEMGPVLIDFFLTLGIISPKVSWWCGRVQNDTWSFVGSPGLFISLRLRRIGWFPSRNFPSTRHGGWRGNSYPYRHTASQAHFDTRCSSVRGEQDHVSPWPWVGLDGLSQAQWIYQMWRNVERYHRRPWVLKYWCVPGRICLLLQ